MSTFHGAQAQEYHHLPVASQRQHIHACTLYSDRAIYYYLGYNYVYIGFSYHIWHTLKVLRNCLGIYVPEAWINEAITLSYLLYELV